MATPESVAAALVLLLNAAPSGTFNTAFTAVQVDVPEFTIEGLETLRVVVAPRTDEETIATRNSVDNTIGVDIGIVQRFADDDPLVEAANLAALKTLREQVKDYVRFKLLASVSAAWVGSANDPIFDPSQYRQNKVFLSVITATYRIL